MVHINCPTRNIISGDIKNSSTISMKSEKFTVYNRFKRKNIFYLKIIDNNVIFENLIHGFGLVSYCVPPATVSATTNCLLKINHFVKIFTDCT